MPGAENIDGNTRGLRTLEVVVAMAYMEQLLLCLLEGWVDEVNNLSKFPAVTAQRSFVRFVYYDDDETGETWEAPRVQNVGMGRGVHFGCLRHL